MEGFLILKLAPGWYFTVVFGTSRTGNFFVLMSVCATAQIEVVRRRTGGDKTAARADHTRMVRMVQYCQY